MKHMVTRRNSHTTDTLSGEIWSADVMQAGDRRRRPFVVPGLAEKTSHPGKTALEDPVPPQQQTDAGQLLTSHPALIAHALRFRRSVRAVWFVCGLIAPRPRFRYFTRARRLNRVFIFQ